MSESPIHFSPPIPFEEYLPPPIPHDIMPGVISEYAGAVSEAIQVPYELPLINILGSIAVNSALKTSQNHQLKTIHLRLMTDLCISEIPINGISP